MMMGGRETASILRRGIFAVNKTKEFTSAELLNHLKRIIMMDSPDEFRPAAVKLGHGGTLDKSAVGVLIVGINWGCKKLPLLLHGAKNYIVVGQLGIATDTYNECGRITDERPYSHITEEDINVVLKQFVGDIWQTAPLYSALKVGGQRMSDLVREGVDVQPRDRLVRCYSAECTDFSPPFFTAHVRCGGGFYIRSLVHDLGIALNTCAHVRQLQRTQQGPFTLPDCLNENEWTLSNILESVMYCQLKFSQFEKRVKRA
ncbi:putative tRNA pseudouridine synthase 1 [Orchesella cincta]|uniref:tRNA pseudouridine(55) synthase n=1 Tax=Orchesella cincta TaxID=48709 RepID=A0A1D2NK71_ORCCI|nr:putative tRNA pseudouridine synthase 1 [Orchesella cincta]